MTMIRNVALTSIMLALTVMPWSHAIPRTRPREPASVGHALLDWFPNTNHAGVYLAKANGWYEEAGLDLRIEASV